MQDASAIVHHPILIGLMLSIALHAAILHHRGIHIQPTPRLETGRTVVQLTLLPTFSSPRNESEPPPAAPPVEQDIQPTPEPATMTTENTLKETTTTTSIEQDATMEEKKGVISEAVVASSFHPNYPRISRRRGEEGTVILSVQVLANGSVDKVDILQSSGYRRLDEAAVKGALQTTFNPARESGCTVDSTTQISYTFRLTDD